MERKRLKFVGSVVVLAIFFVAFGFILISPSDTPEINTLEFSDEKLGLRFSYPAYFGNVIFESQMVETGEKISATFENNQDFQFGGITEDFSAGRGGMLTDTRGFLKQDDTYYFKFVSAKSDTIYPLQPLKILQKDFGEIVILNDQSFEAERLGADGPIMGLGVGNLAALVNLKNADFPGFVFWNLNTKLFPLVEFEELLNSIEVSEVTFLTYTDPGNNYSFTYPVGWYPHQIDEIGVLFTKKRELVVLPGTEGYSIGPQFAVALHEFGQIEGVSTQEDWLELYGLGYDSDFLESREVVDVNGNEMIRGVIQAGGVDFNMLSYIYLMNSVYIVSISHFPYEPSSVESEDFEGVIRTFSPTEGL